MMSSDITVINKLLPNSNKNRSTPNKNSHQYNTGINNKKRMPTTLNPSTAHPNRTQVSTCHIVCLKQQTHVVEMVTLENDIYQGTQNRRIPYISPPPPFRLPHTDHVQWAFHHRGSPRSNNWLKSASACVLEHNRLASM